MISKIIQIVLLAVVLLAFPMQAMEKKVEITFKTTYEVPEKIFKKLGYLSNACQLCEEESERDFGIKQLLKNNKKTEDDFVRHIELTEKYEFGNFPLLIHELTDKEFVTHVQLADIFDNKILLPCLKKHLTSIIKEEGRKYCLYGKVRLKKILDKLPPGFCEEALYPLPSPPFKILKGQSPWVKYIEMLDDYRVKFASNDNIVKCWDLKDGKCSQTADGSMPKKNSYIKINDHKAVLVSGNTLKVWDQKSETFSKVLEGHTEAVTSVVWVKKLARIVSGSFDQTLRVWDLRTGKCSKILRGHQEGVTSLVEVKESQVVSGSLDGILKLWKLDKKRCSQTFEGHEAGITALVKIKDDQFVSGASDGTLKFWDLNRLKQVSFEQALFFKILKSSDTSYLFRWPQHAYEIFCMLPDDLQETAKERQLVFKPLLIKRIWNCVKSVRYNR